MVSSFTEDTSISIGNKNVLIKKDTAFSILFEYIHHDPVQWKDPKRFEPRRFDLNDPEWTLTSDGKPRNPLAFTPFLGGKRICIGKTFAEVAIRYTIPIIFAHLDFEFVNP